MTCTWRKYRDLQCTNKSIYTCASTSCYTIILHVAYNIQRKWSIKWSEITVFVENNLAVKHIVQHIQYWHSEVTFIPTGHNNSSREHFNSPLAFQWSVFKTYIYSKNIWKEPSLTELWKPMGNMQEYCTFTSFWKN